jgi:hypothetical protein
MREITVRFGDVSSDQYADIVNAIWMQMNLVGCDFTVTPDGQAVATELDRRWDDYSRVSWEAGGRRGTPQAVAASAARTSADDYAGAGE